MTETTAPSGRAWARGIVLAILVFACGTLGMVGIALSTSTDLVSADYYQREIDFQQQIDRQERTLALPEGVDWRLRLGENNLTLSFPLGHFGEAPSGIIRLYRPDDASLDHDVVIELDADGRQQIPMTGLAAGRWRVHIEWVADGQQYYSEARLHLDPSGTGS